ncbi:metal-dependent hydrolase [Geothrix alkalitolerans]|uniref:metal-dependent hydrolase n=1 Tax=Geothrix alkalitolerans TaxID=2922724 RepID=UPI001FAEFB48|nr:metal-dependent hydrolase [Geothrix alkalitolerans]
MPTILSHPAVPLALGVGFGPKAIPRPLLVTGIVASVLPDLDVIAFRLGIPYSAALGHRGFSHSLGLAAVMALGGAWALRQARSPFPAAFGFLFLSMASHGLLDALTTGGRGIALFWPFTDRRFFGPLQVIRVSPLSAARLLSSRGLAVFLSEILWVWLPSAVLALGLWTLRRGRRLPVGPCPDPIRPGLPSPPDLPRGNP